MTFSRQNSRRPALDSPAIERLALHYVGRYATSRAKLADYLRRKIRERGWEGEGEPPIEAIVNHIATLGYVDDQAVAEAKGRSLAARGYGARRLGQALDMLGIGEEDAAPTRRQAEEDAWETALRFARRRRFGPFVDRPVDDAARRRAFGAMVRAGHAPRHVRRILDAPPGIVPEQDES